MAVIKLKVDYGHRGGPNQMNQMKVSISKDKSTLLIELPITNPPKPSKTGRTLLVATTGGNKDSGVIVNGKELMVGVNAYVYATDKGTGTGTANAAAAE